MNDANVINMNIKPAAVAKIKQNVKDNQVILLSLNDGSNKYSKIGGTCTIGANFQFVICAQKDPAFTVKIANNAGFDLYTSPSEMQFLSDGLVVDEKNAALSLADDSGMIDSAVTINHYQEADQ